MFVRPVNKQLQRRMGGNKVLFGSRLKRLKKRCYEGVVIEDDPIENRINYL